MGHLTHDGTPDHIYFTFILTPKSVRLLTAAHSLSLFSCYQATTLLWQYKDALQFMLYVNTTEVFSQQLVFKGTFYTLSVFTYLLSKVVLAGRRN